MTAQALQHLQPGQRYRVRAKGHRTHTRIFLYHETRFGNIPCAVFSAQVRGPLDVQVLAPGRIRYNGSTPPRSELSVPHYDLDFCDPIDPIGPCRSDHSSLS